MKILLTNDDGIAGEGLRLLAEWSRTVGEILIVAPKAEQSAMGQSIVLRRPFEVKRSDLFDDLGIESYSLDSTPADCVRFATDRFGPFDFVFSGMNRGLNLGFDIAYSGACGAAFEVNYAGILSSQKIHRRLLQQNGQPQLRLPVLLQKYFVILTVSPHIPHRPFR